MTFATGPGIMRMLVEAMGFGSWTGLISREDRGDWV